MNRTQRRGAMRRAGNVFLTALCRVGLAPKRIFLLVTRGRRSGRERITPVALVLDDSARWLVAPYGTVSWVHNARAAGYVTLRRRGYSQDFNIEEAGPREAAPILKRYVNENPLVLRHFEAGKDSPPEHFEAEAARHPVFRLLPR
jgi:deazaflavin-dependent oxidoreductase (nitroreductase family)